MEITYQRDVSHCEVSLYVKMVTISKILPAQNSDFLDHVEFIEMGWNAIAKRDQYKVGDSVMFIPPDSVLPFELSEILNITNYTSKGRIRITRLRGNRSEGLIVDKDLVAPWIPYIMKWEDPPSVHFRGDSVPRVACPNDFLVFYKMPNILNEPFTFGVGERVVHSEKIHGTNSRFGVFKNPETDEYTDYVGSHNVVLKESDDNVYWRAYNKFFRGKIPSDLVFFGEVYGKNIQHLDYGENDIAAIVFAVMKNGEYLSPVVVTEICNKYNLPVVKFHEFVYDDIESVRVLADAPSEMTDNHHREGIVMVSIDSPNRMAKCIGETYWTQNQGKHKKKRTERH